MIRKLGFAMAGLLVTLALTSSPAEGNCTGVCTGYYTICLKNCGHNPSCTQGCQANRLDCYCTSCGIC